MKLNVGSGSDYKNGWVNLDYKEPCDIKFDLNIYPCKLPFKSNNFDYILCSHNLEHLMFPLGVVLELIRVLKKGKDIKFKLPNSNNSSLEHLRYEHGVNYFNCLTKDNDLTNDTEKLLENIYVKRNLRNPITIYYKIRNKIINTLTDECEYKYKKL